MFISFLKNKVGFIYFCFIIFGCVGSLLLHSLSLASGGYSNCSAQASHYGSFSSGGARAQQLWYTGIVVPQHVESFWTRD